MQTVKTAKNTNIVPSEAPELVNYVAKSIINAVKAPDAEYTVKPGIEYFQEIVGQKKDGSSFVFKHIPKKKRGDQAKIYASYDGLEFTCEFETLRNDFFSLEAFINKKYVYDANTDSYVPRPSSVSLLSVASRWFRSNEK